MTELVSASKPAFYIIRKGALWFLSKISKRLQKEFFPVDFELLNIRLQRNPRIYANSENSFIEMEFNVSNFSPYYDYGILSMECELWIWQRKFLMLTSNQFLDMKVDVLNKQESK